MKKRTYTSQFKTQVVLEVVKEEKTIGEIASEHEINPNQIRAWRKEFVDKASSVFEESTQNRARIREERLAEAERADMLKTIGQLTLERDWLKKKSEEIFGPDYEKKFSKRPF